MEYTQRQIAQMVFDNNGVCPKEIPARYCRGICPLSKVCGPGNSKKTLDKARVFLGSSIDNSEIISTRLKHIEV